MISVYKIKPLFQQLLRPVLAGLYDLGATANHLTVSAILLSAGLGVLFWLYPSGPMLLIYPLGLFVRMALNALDGMMARTYHMQSRGGEFLNELGDVVSDALVYLPLVKLPGMNAYVLASFVYLAYPVYCRERIGGEELTGRPVPYFCYPFGAIIITW